MNCSKCGTFNNLGSKFCISCGNQLEVSQEVNNQNYNNVENINYQQPVQETVVNQIPVQNNYEMPSLSKETVNTAPLNYLTYMVAVMLKPFQSFKEEEEKLNNPKTSIILSVIVAAIIMLVVFIKTIITTVMVTSYDFKAGAEKTTFQFERLKSLDYIDLIGKNFLICAGIILTIAVVYYLATLVMKKSISFPKMLSISATSIIPFILLGLICSPILGKIWSYLSIVLVIAGFVYSLIILITLVKEQVALDKPDMNIYYHTACLSILGFAGYYFALKVIIASSIAASLN